MIPTVTFVAGHVTAHAQLSDGFRLVSGPRIWKGEADRDLLAGVLEKPFQHAIEKIHSLAPDPDSARRDVHERLYLRGLASGAQPWRACLSANMSTLNHPAVVFDERFVGWGFEDFELAYRLCEVHRFTPVFLERDILCYHVELSAACGNIFRGRTRKEVVWYMRNAFLCWSLCGGLRIQDVFFGFRRIAYDELNDEWIVLQREKAITATELPARVRQAQHWLARRGYFRDFRVRTII